MRRAMAFLTPLGGARAPHPSMVAWFPVVGVGIGAAVGGVWWAAARVWAPAVAGAVALTADLALTGLLHIDGLIDTADGLLPHLPRQRRLAVMAEPTVGAFGVAAGAAVLLLRFAAFATMRPNVGTVVAIWCMSRTVMAVTTGAVPYARDEGGLATEMIGAGWRGVAIYGVLVASVVAWIAAGWRADAAVAACAVAGAGVIALGWRRLGGFTGDVVGAAGVVGETVALLVAAAK